MHWSLTLSWLRFKVNSSESEFRQRWRAFKGVRHRSVLWGWQCLDRTFNRSGRSNITGNNILVLLCDLLQTDMIHAASKCACWATDTVSSSGYVQLLRGTISKRYLPGSSELRGSSLTLLKLTWMTPCRATTGAQTRGGGQNEFTVTKQLLTLSCCSFTTSPLSPSVLP